MTMYGLPDITGTNPRYLQVNIPFLVYENNVKLVFENSPVYVESIRIAKTDGSGTLLRRNVDWRAGPEDVDQMAMSRARLQDPSFNKVLVKSITFINTNLLGETIAANVQQFYDTVPGRFFDDGVPLELTPDVIKHILSVQAGLVQQYSSVKSPIVSNDYVPKLFDFDINKERADNKVVGEKITVNTVSGSSVIRLSQGAYFLDSLVIKKNGVALTKTSDYLPIVVSPLTRETTNASGIYQYVMLVSEQTGELSIDYHAVGGDVQVDDIRAVLDTSTAIAEFLNNQPFVTPQSLQNTPAFQAVFARLQELEKDMRILTSGSPTYGDATAGQVVRRPVQAPNANFHWYTIANLYKVQGSSDVVLADQFKGRVFFPGAKVSLGFVVDVNLSVARNPVSFTTNALVFDPLYTLFEDVSVAAPVYPMLRVVWNKLTNGLAGASLQVGIALPGLSDTMVVEDLSSTQSCWLLDKTGAQISGGETVSPSGPRDTGFTLPDGSSLWASGSAISESRVHVPAFDKGYLAYAGSAVILTNLNTSSSTSNLLPLVLASYLPISNLNTLVVTLTSSDGLTAYDVEVVLPNRSTTANVKSGKTVFTDSKNVTMTMAATLNQNATNGTYSVSLNVSSPPGTPADSVKYIRVRV